MIKTKVAFFRGLAFFQPIRALEYLLNALIGWIKAGPPQKPLLF